MPWKSTTTTGSFPTTHASCPGGTNDISPGPTSFAVPSFITIWRTPETWYWKWGASQLSVFAIGFTCLDHLHPGSNLARPIVPPPIFTSSIFPFSNLRTSSGELRCLTSILDEGIERSFAPSIIRLVVYGIWGTNQIELGI